MAEWSHTTSVEKLIHVATSNDPKSYNFMDEGSLQLLQITICDKINSSTHNCQQAAKAVYNILQIDKSDRFYQLVLLFEFCAKNTDRRFHLCLGTDIFADAFLARLSRVRGKAKLKMKLDTKPQKQKWHEGQEKLLGLIQAWADTFIMQEDQYPGFQKVYRQLRKEGVKFPVRDPNLRVYMENLVKDSPMYEFCEQSAGVEVRMPLPAQNAPAQIPQPVQKVSKAVAVKKVQKDFFEQQEAEMEKDINDQDINDSDDLWLANEDRIVIEGGAQLLNDMRLCAESVQDLQSEVVTEIYGTLLLARKRIIKINSATDMRMQQAEVNQQLDMADMFMAAMTDNMAMLDVIDDSLREFKKTYSQLKNPSKVKAKKPKKEELKQEQPEKEEQSQNPFEDVEEVKEEKSLTKAKKLMAPSSNSLHQLRALKNKMQKQDSSVEPEAAADVIEDLLQMEIPASNSETVQNNGAIDLDELLNLGSGSCEVKAQSYPEQTQEQVHQEQIIDLLAPMQAQPIQTQPIQWQMPVTQQQQQAPQEDDFFASLANRN